MNILAFTDVHANKRLLKEIVKKAERAELLVCSGDLSFFGKGLEESIKILMKAKKRILIIHGNHESEEQIIRLTNKHKNLINIHKKTFIINDYMIVGYGGGGFSMHDKKLEQYFIKFHNKYKNSNKKIIIVTHAPAGNTKLDIIPGLGHRGNISITNVIMRLKPVLYICGHFHEDFGKKDKIGNTLLINPGCDGKIINI